MESSITAAMDIVFIFLFYTDFIGLPMRVDNDLILIKKYNLCESRAKRTNLTKQRRFSQKCGRSSPAEIGPWKHSGYRLFQ